MMIGRAQAQVKPVAIKTHCGDRTMGDAVTICDFAVRCLFIGSHRHYWEIRAVRGPGDRSEVASLENLCFFRDVEQEPSHGLEFSDPDVARVAVIGRVCVVEILLDLVRAFARLQAAGGDAKVGRGPLHFSHMAPPETATGRLPLVPPRFTPPRTGVLGLSRDLSRQFALIRKGESLPLTTDIAHSRDIPVAHDHFSCIGRAESLSLCHLTYIS